MSRRVARLRKHRRGEWMTSANGAMRMTLGERKGNLLHIRQKRPGGVFSVRVWRGDRWTECSLGTCVAEEALSLARAKQAESVDRSKPRTTDRVLLGDLCRRFPVEDRTWQRTTPDNQSDGASRARFLEAFFGSHFDVTDISQDDIERYVDDRTSGRILIDGSPGQGVSRYSSVADFHFLSRMLNWATTVKIGPKRYWLSRNPLKGLRLPQTEEPVREYADTDQFEATMKAVDELIAEAEASIKPPPTKSRARANAKYRRPRLEPSFKWRQLRLALVFAEATGRRLGSIRQLRWSDIDLSGQTIRWRRETDKKGHETLLRVPPGLMAAIENYRECMPVTEDGWVFAAQEKPGQPSDRHLFDNWLRTAEKRAGVKKLKHGLWHPYRRAWAMRRKHHSPSDVMQVGGWRDYETLRLCYQQPDESTMLKVIEDVRPLRKSATPRAAAVSEGILSM